MSPSLLMPEIIRAQQTGRVQYDKLGRLVPQPEIMVSGNPAAVEANRRPLYENVYQDWQAIPPERRMEGIKAAGRVMGNAALDFIPGVGDLKSAQEAITGTQPMLEGLPGVSHKLTIPERIGAGIGALPFVPNVAGMLKKMPGLDMLSSVTGKGGKADIPAGKTPKAEGGVEFLKANEPITESQLVKVADQYAKEFGEHITIKEHPITLPETGKSVMTYDAYLGEKQITSGSISQNAQDVRESGKRVLWNMVHSQGRVDWWDEFEDKEVYKYLSGHDFFELLAKGNFGSAQLAEDFMKRAGVIVPRGIKPERGPKLGGLFAAAKLEAPKVIELNAILEQRSPKYKDGVRAVFIGNDWSISPRQAVSDKSEFLNVKINLKELIPSGAIVRFGDEAEVVSYPKRGVLQIGQMKFSTSGDIEELLKNNLIIESPNPTRPPESKLELPEEITRRKK